MTAETSTPSAGTALPGTVPQVDDQERPGRELGGWPDRVVAAVAFAVAVADDLAGVPPAAAGQPVLPDRVPRRDAAAGVIWSTDPGWAGSIRTTGRVSSTGCWPRSPWWSACTRSCRSASGRVAAVTTRSWTDRACSNRWTSRWARCCSCSSWRRAGGPPAGRCPSCAGCSSRTATTAGCCPRAGRSRMPGWTSIRSSTRCTTRAAASSGLRSTSRRPTSCCSRSTVRCSNSPAAARFFVDLSVAAFRRSRSAAGRTDGGVGIPARHGLGLGYGDRRQRRRGRPGRSCVGPATTPERAGGVLAAAGVGALLSPPTLGAAAFIVAEYLEVSYLTVLGWATIPTVLYYLGILLAVEIDARRFGVHPANLDGQSPWKLLAPLRVSLLVVDRDRRAAGIRDVSATRAVVYATALAFVLSFLDRRGRLTPRRLFDALSSGVRGVLPVVAVCAAAGRDHGDDHQDRSRRTVFVRACRRSRRDHRQPHRMLALTAVFAAVALAMLGLAIPVTASFVIGWVIIGPALLDARRLRTGRRDVRLLLLGALRGHPADGAGRRRGLGGHRRAGDPDDVADAAVRRARVPGPHRVRADRAWRVPARPRPGGRGAVGLPRRRVRASWRCPSPPAGGCSVWGRRVGFRACSPARRRCCCCSSIPSPSWRVWRVCSLQSRSPSSTRGDGHETVDNGVRGAGARPASQRRAAVAGRTHRAPTPVARSPVRSAPTPG